MNTSLYRFFDADGNLLYVGITHRLNERFSAHKKEKPWDHIARVAIEHFPDRESALVAESEAIRTEKPQWNVVHTSPRHHKTKMSYYAKARQMWPDAEWVSGSGKYATVAHCRVTTVELHTDLEKAERALDAINRTACGGLCYRDHWFYNLESGFFYREGWAGSA